MRQAFEETSGHVRSERVNKLPNCDRYMIIMIMMMIIIII
jgi:hypothetical protein